MPRWGPLGAIAFGFVGLVFLFKGVDWAVELLWMRGLGYEAVFWRLRLVKVGLFVSGFAVAFLYVWINLLHVARRTGIARLDPAASAPSGGATVSAGLLALAAGAPGVLFGTILYGSWDEVLRLLFGATVGDRDPIFGADVGFYLFALPFLETVQGTLVAVALLTVAGLGALYHYGGQLDVSQRRVRIEPAALRHLAANVIVLLAAWAWGYYLDRYQLLTDDSGAVFGAGYTDVHVTLWALWAALAATAALIAAVAMAARAGDLRPAVWGLAGYGGFLVVGFGIVPFGVQQFVVEPSELELETPYLRHNIAFTRRAFALDRISERDYGSRAGLELGDVHTRQATVDNIRLWDWRPLDQTFRQLQQIRAYYTFLDVDTDRYLIDGAYRQVMLAARELSEDLPDKGRTWVNERLQYTHGYGLAMSLASDKAADGTPPLIVKDLPPQGPVDLAVLRPEVYYGEEASGYRIVNTGLKEFDYPHGDENVYTRYAGGGGLRLDANWKRVLLAWHQFDLSILLTTYVTDNSRLQLWREIGERVTRIAPFLELDSNPYLVVHDGRLVWIQDAYTTADDYPYAEPYRGEFGYIRNSVKVVVDAYEGSVEFYIVEPDDPVVGAYRAAFPSLFRPLAAMPEDLRRHIRYPQRLFGVQLETYATYHMTVPQVFYNGEDVWGVPREKYGGEEILMQPYYILAQLPGGAQLEYLLISPLTPVNRDNMIAWMAARSDPPHYGEVMVFKLSKERLILGPIQIEAMIDQDTVISRQLSLWDQRGSRVIRGNLLVIPIGPGFLYVEPVYLRAETTDIPQLKRVIVSDGRRIAMQPTLAEALAVVFDEAAPQAAPAAPLASGTEALSRAREALDRAQDALRRSDWEAFGRAMKALEEELER